MPSSLVKKEMFLPVCITSILRAGTLCANKPLLIITSRLCAQTMKGWLHWMRSFITFYISRHSNSEGFAWVKNCVSLLHFSPLLLPSCFMLFCFSSRCITLLLRIDCWKFDLGLVWVAVCGWWWWWWWWRSRWLWGGWRQGVSWPRSHDLCWHLLHKPHSLSHHGFAAFSRELRWRLVARCLYICQCKFSV